MAAPKRSAFSMSLLRQLLQDARELARANARGADVTRHHYVSGVTSDGFQILLVQRLREQLRRFHVPLGNHLLRRFTTVVYGLELGNDVTVGDGVSFVHPIAIVVGGDAKIGARVRFMGNNTVGTAKDDGYPVIEDDVLIGAGARVLGPVRVGRGAVIGANAVVVHDVPPGAVVTGVPARPHVRKSAEPEVVAPKPRRKTS